MLAAMIANSTYLLAQDSKADKVKADKNKDKVTIEDIQPVCTNLAKNKKPRLTVANFKLTAPNAPKDQYGDNLATMLSNALQKVQCYTVLERIANMADVDAEVNYQQKSGNVSAKSKVTKGNQIGANVIVQGEITEFEQSNKSAGIAIVKTTTFKAKVGIIIRMVDPETREIIATESFNVEKKVGGGLKVGVHVPYIGDINAMSTVFQNPAVQDATEDCIIKAVEYIASQKDKVNMPVNDVPEGSAKYILTFKNIEYGQLSTVVAALEKIPGVSNVNSDDFENNNANVVVTQSIKLKDVVEKLMAANTGVKLSVSGMTKESATFSIK